MKIELANIDREQFMVHDHVLCGEVMQLVQPQHIGCKWTQDNKHFRSSLWNAQGELVSAGFPKFTNWGENPENFPVPSDLRGVTITEKLDGSLLIVSKYKGQFILRTRGTSDASTLDNGSELELFKQKYPNVFTYQPYFETWPFTLLFEWTSPVQKIVINYGEEADWSLVGCIAHSNSPIYGDYWLYQQDFLDAMAKGFGCKRPNYYTFNTVADLLADVEVWTGKEGVVVYSKNGQALHKVKGAWYLVRHHMKSELSSLDKVIDFWVNAGKPDYQGLKDAIVQFDIELWGHPTIGFVSRIAEGYKEVQKIHLGMCNFVNMVKGSFNTRKEQAQSIIKAYGDTNRASFCFKLLDGKVLADDDIKKLLYQVLK